MTNLLPHGVKRHLQTPESAQVINMMLSSGKLAYSVGEIGDTLHVPSAQVRVRLIRMRSLGIIGMENKIPGAAKWYIPMSFRQPLKEYMQGVEL